MSLCWAWLVVLPVLAVDCDLKTLGNACGHWAYDDKLTVRWLRGDRMRDIKGVFGEFAAALQFPWYFGRNSAAMNECLCDLDWIEFSGIVIVIFDADQILADDENDLGCHAWLVVVLTGVTPVRD